MRRHGLIRAKTKNAHTKRYKQCAKVLALLCACTSASFAQISGLQSVSPRQVFTGDSVSVSYSFESSTDFFALANSDLFIQDSPQSGGSRLVFSFLGEEVLENPSDALVQECALEKTKGGWTFCVSMIPWQTGEIRFRAIDLEELCTSGKVSGFQTQGLSSQIVLQPVEVLSVSQKTGEGSLRPVAEPPLLPRTRRLLRILTVAMVVVVCTILVLTRRRIVRALKTIIASAVYKRSSHVTQKRISRLLKSPISDRAVCENWMQAMKAYLSVRFGRDFANTTPEDVSRSVFDATGGLLTGEREQAAEDLGVLFSRAAYIAQSGRVGGGVRFSSGEKETFVLRTLKVINTFDFLGDEEEDVRFKAEDR